MKRLTVVPGSRTEPPEGAPERRTSPRLERRKSQRRLEVARRIYGERRVLDLAPPPDVLFVDSRSGRERRGLSSRRRLRDRRSGVRSLDLTSLDLSELDR